MTTWTLILIFAAGSNAAVITTITDISSLSECLRIDSTIRRGDIGQEYRFSRTIFQCVEVKK